MYPRNTNNLQLRWKFGVLGGVVSIPAGKLMMNFLGLERWKAQEVNAGLRISGRKISLKKEGLMPVCGLMRYAEVVGSLLSQVNYLGYITRALPSLSVCCRHNTIPRIEGTQEGFSSWHNSQALREKEKKKVLKFVSFQMFWNIARPTHKRKLAPTSEVRPYISLNCSHNS